MLTEITDPEWLAVIVPVVLVVGGGAIKIWRDHRRRQRERFRPQIKAAIDEQRQAIRLDVTNGGKDGGSVSDVAVVNAHRELPATFPCYQGGEFAQTPLGSSEHVMIVIHAVPPKSFPEDVRLRVGWSGGEDHFTPEHTDERYYNLKPQLPWACQRQSDGSWHHNEERTA